MPPNLSGTHSNWLYNLKRHARECGYPRRATHAITSGLDRLPGVDGRIRGHDGTGRRYNDDFHTSAYTT
jgi:hypothetical protein